MLLMFITGAALFSIFFILYMYRLAKKNTIIRHELHLPGFPAAFDGLRLFFISDIHHRTIHEEILEQIKGKIDLIIIGGDLMEKGVPFSKVEKNIVSLRAIAPTVFVWGNHDYAADYRRLDALLAENNVTVLANEVQMFEQGRERLYIVGVDDVGKKRDNLPLALNDCEQAGFKIVACHYPEISKKIRKEDGVGLVVSGHNHGGQIRLFGFGVRELGGVKQYESFTQIISNGYGTTRLPLRLGAAPQTHIIQLFTE